METYGHGPQGLTIVPGWETQNLRLTQPQPTFIFLAYHEANAFGVNLQMLDLAQSSATGLDRGTMPPEVKR